MLVPEQPNADQVNAQIVVRSVRPELASADASGPAEHVDCLHIAAVEDLARLLHRAPAARFRLLGSRDVGILRE